MNTRKIVAGLFGAALLMFGTSVARAGEDSLDNALGLGPDSASGYVSDLSELYDLGATIDAAVSGATVSEGIVTVPGSTTGTTSVASNNISALATGNSNVSIVDTLTMGLGTNTPTTDGIAVLDFSINGGSTITSSVITSTFSQDLSDFTIGTANLNSNTLTAQTLLNTETATVSGQVPLTYDSGVGGSIAFDSTGGPLLLTDGSTAVANVQNNIGSGEEGGSSAAVGDTGAPLADANTISQDIHNTTANPEIVTSSPQVNDNAMSAVFFGNTANNSVSLEPGTNVAFDGSVSVFNGQGNFDSFGAVGGTVSTNTDSTISSTITADSTGSETLSGTLELDRNSISSLAVGNSAANNDGNSTSGNTITLADGLDFSGGHAGSDGGSDATIATGTLVLNADADLVLGNVQINDANPLSLNNPGTGLGAETTSAHIVATVDNMDGGAIDPNHNSITATSQGSEAYNAITAGGPNTATFDGSSAIGSVQSNANTSFTGKTTDAQINAFVAQGAGQTITDSSVDVSFNTVGAYAGAGSATNVLSLEATTLTMGDNTDDAALTADRDSEVADDIAGGATINNVQSSYSDGGANTTATNLGTEIQLFASGTTEVTSDELTADSNTIEAIAQTNNGLSAIDLTATTMTGSAGVLTLQTDDSPTSANVHDAIVTLEAANSFVGLGTAVDASSLDLSGNLMRALAYGNSGGGTITATATTMTFADNGDFAGDVFVEANNYPFDEDAAFAPVFAGGLVVFTDQKVSDNNVSALTDTASTHAFEITVGSDGGGISGSDLTADSNAFVAAARGNVSSNGVDANATTMDVATGNYAYEPIAVVGNIQTIEDGVNVTADSDTGTAATIYVDIASGVFDSSLSASDNLLTAIAGGNYSTNTVHASGTTITDDISGNTNPPPTALTGAAFDGGAGEIITDAAFSVTNAQFGGDGLREAQVDADPLRTEAAILITTGSDDGIGIVDSALTASGNVLQAVALDNSETSTVTFDPVTLDATAAINNFQISAADVQSQVLNGREIHGVEIAAGGDVIDSTLTVDHSLFDSSSTGNEAFNTISAGATTMGAGEDLTTLVTEGALADFGNSIVLADGTFSLLSQQYFIDGSITADNYASDVISSDGNSVTGSALSVSNNVAQGVAIGNAATNGITLAMTDSADDYAPSASLLSIQNNTGDVGTPTVSAQSTFEGNSVGVVTDSSVTLDGNTNLALGIINDASNSMSVSASAVLGSAYGATDAVSNIDFVAGTVSASADYAVENIQSATNSVSASASSVIQNNDNVSGVSGTTDSAISLSGNHTTAEADANRASNSLSLNAGSTLGANGAMTSSQDSDATVTASVSSNVNYTTGNAGGNATSFDGSTVNANGNTAAAIANGNAVSNALNADAGALYNGNSTSASSTNSGTALNATAQYAVLNAQDNSGDVGATATGGVNVSLTGTDGVTGSTATVNGNSFLAQATGNGASNSISMTGLVGGTATAAIMNSQQNGGGNTVSASVTGVTMGINATGVVSSSMTVNTNTITASATGNSAVNVITTH